MFVRFSFIATVLWSLSMLLVGPGCGDSPVEITNQELTVACGMCLFSMPDTRGCYWAVEIDEKHYTVSGVFPRDHQNHAPDGMCNVRRRAILDGTIRGQTFVASRFELQAASSVPEKPKFTPADLH